MTPGLPSALYAFRLLCFVGMAVIVLCGIGQAMWARKDKP